MKYTHDEKSLPTRERLASARGMLMLPFCLLALLAFGCAKQAQNPPEELPAPQVVALPLLENSQFSKDRRFDSGMRPPRGSLQEVVAAARQNIGVPYKYGGTTPQTGFDCSGLVCWSYEKVGVALPRRAQDQYFYGNKVPSREELMPGDIVLFKGTNNRSGWHSGIYSGNGNFIHSPRTGKSVEEISLNNRYFAERYVGARRVQQRGRAATMFDQTRQREQQAIRNQLLLARSDKSGLNAPRQSNKTSVSALLASSAPKATATSTRDARAGAKKSNPAAAKSSSKSTVVAQGKSDKQTKATQRVLASAEKKSDKAQSAKKSDKARSADTSKKSGSDKSVVVAGKSGATAGASGKNDKKSTEKKSDEKAIQLAATKGGQEGAAKADKPRSSRSFDERHATSGKDAKKKEHTVVVADAGKTSAKSSASTKDAAGKTAGTKEAGAEVAATAKPAKQDKAVAEAKSKPAKQDKAVADAKAKPAKQDKAVADAKAKPARQDKAVADAKTKPAKQDKAVADAKAKPAKQDKAKDAKSGKATVASAPAAKKADNTKAEKNQQAGKAAPAQKTGKDAGKKEAQKADGSKSVASADKAGKSGKGSGTTAGTGGKQPDKKAAAQGKSQKTADADKKKTPIQVAASR